MVLKLVCQGKFSELQSLLKESPEKGKLFVERVQEASVAKDCSPLVVAVINNQLDIFKYILEHYTPNLEQETSAVIEGGYPVDGATPLWTASTLGHLNFVKLLVKHGADIEHTTVSKSTPLRGAAFDGHCKVCEFLIEQGANVDKPNQVGQSPLTIAAAMQKKECVTLLIKKGADIKHRGHNGDTPLHVSVESGDVAIAGLLVDAGAENTPNDVGFTPSILASCYGHKDVMEYLHDTFHLKPKELYDCYCLLAAKEVLGGNDDNAKKRMHEAVRIRSANPSMFTKLPQAAPHMYDGLQEPASEADIQHIALDETRLFFVSSIYCERILGRIHPTTAFYIRISGDIALAENRYKKCIDLWQRSLDFDKAARMAYELQITEDLLFAIRGFSIMADDNFIPPVQPHFQWGLKEFKLAHESKISEVSVISCLFRMIAVWIKVADCIKDPLKNAQEKELISQAVVDLRDAMEGNSCSLLTACLQNVPDHGGGAGKDVYSQSLPLGKVIGLLLDHGCSVHCEDDNGNFPLHLAVMLRDESTPECVKALLDYGAHADAVNFDNKTALELAVTSTNPGVVAELLKATRVVSLQCLASQSLIRAAIDYKYILPPKLVSFVSWHGV